MLSTEMLHVAESPDLKDVFDGHATHHCNNDSVARRPLCAYALEMIGAGGSNIQRGSRRLTTKIDGAPFRRRVISLAIAESGSAQQQ